MNDDRPSFLSGVIRPWECFRAGWKLVKDDYWLFLGITFVGTLIASLAPLGILLGPTMCGIYYCLFRRERGRPVRFEMLFKGFDVFVQSLIASLIMIVPLLIVIVPAYIAFIAIVFSTMPQQPGAKPGPDAAGTIIGAYVVFILLVMVVSVVVAVLFFFTYPLIVDRRMKGIDAVKTSIQAARANLGGVLGVVLLNMLFNLLGYLACCVGVIFVMPLHFAAIAVAYRQVFPAEPTPEPVDDAKTDFGDPELEAGPATE